MEGRELKGKKLGWGRGLSIDPCLSTHSSLCTEKLAES